MMLHLTYFVVIAIGVTTRDAVESDCMLAHNLKYTGYSLKTGTGCTQYVHCRDGVVSSTQAYPAGTLYNSDVCQGGICNWSTLV